MEPYQIGMSVFFTDDDGDVYPAIVTGEGEEDGEIKISIDGTDYFVSKENVSPR